MFITQHARARIAARVGATQASGLLELLESLVGRAGTYAYILADVPLRWVPDGSNGDIMVAVAVDGSIETLYYRRTGQDLSKEFFGAEQVVDLRPYPSVRS